jgi:quercetin dioxygenase-like cupin family protein
VVSESFLVLFGTVRLYDGERWIEATTGDFLFVHEGGIHAFRNESSEAASMLLLFAPGAPREDYFETLAEVASGGVLSEEERSEFYLKHDTYWL